jgi:LmbE family N-acetylglucosaminyl deacetylase
MPLIRKASALRDLREAPRRLLAVFPHPDDESYGCAGALARAGTDPDAAAVLLTLTRGEASSMGPARGLSREEVGRLRESRLEEVARVAGLDGLIVSDLPDGRLARFDLDAAAERVREVLEAFEPQVVIGHDPRGVNAHPDHIASHFILRRALGDGNGTRFAMTAYPRALTEDIPRLLFPTDEGEIDAVIRLTEEEAAKKEACLRVHEALVTLDDDGDPSLIRRPPVEHFDLLGEEHSPPLPDLFD